MMNARHIGRMLPVLLWALTTGWTGSAMAATEAGRVAFAYGQVVVVGQDGASRAVRRGSRVYSGDTITTRRGRIQVRFSDGGFVSLIPDTSFKIDDYRFDGREDGAERGFFSLIKGGLRALTGLVGRKNREAYQLRTQVATIGIRGTLFRATFDPKLMKFLVSVGFDPTDPKGGLLVKAGGRVLPVVPGGSAVVEGEGSPARPTTEQAQLTAAQPDEAGIELVSTGDEPTFTQGDINRGSVGSDSGVGSSTTLSEAIIVGAETWLEFDTFFNGMPFVDLGPDSQSDAEPEFNLFYRNSAGEITGALYVTGDLVEIGLTTIDLAGMLNSDNVEANEIVALLVEAARAEISGLDGIIDQFEANPGKVLEYGEDASYGLTWGRLGQGRILEIDYDSDFDEWDASADLYQGSQSGHFAFGTPPEQLPGAGVAEYQLIPGAATRSTTASGNSIGNGLVAGTIMVDFGTLRAMSSLTVDHGGTISVSTYGAPDTPLHDGLFSNGTGFLTMGSATGGPCNPSCGAYVNGVLTDNAGGPVPNGAAASYKLALPSNDKIHGVGGFKNTGYDVEATIPSPP